MQANNCPDIPGFFDRFFANVDLISCDFEIGIYTNNRYDKSIENNNDLIRLDQFAQYSCNPKDKYSEVQ